MQKLVSFFGFIIGLIFPAIIYAIPVTLANNLQQTRVLMLSTFLRAPYIVTEHQKKVYVRGLHAPLGTHFVVLRRGSSLTEPHNNADLGIIAYYVATAKLIQTGDPAILQVAKGNRIIHQGDRLFLPMKQLRYVISYNMTNKVNAQIIATLRGTNKIGLHDIVVLNYGKSSGALPGQIFPIVRMPVLPLERFIHHSTHSSFTYVKLGSLMLIQSFTHTSFAVILNIKKPINILDHIVSLPFWKAYVHRH